MKKNKNVITTLLMTTVLGLVIAIKEAILHKSAKTDCRKSLGKGHNPHYHNTTSVKRRHLSQNAVIVKGRLGHGKENALLVDGDVDGLNARQIQKAVHELREVGIPVVNTGDGGGYYIPRSDRPSEMRELSHNIRQLEGRADKIQHSARKMKTASEKLTDSDASKKFSDAVDEFEKQLAAAKKAIEDHKKKA